MRRCDSITFASTKDLGDGLHSNWGTNVDMTENCSTSDVEPIRIIGSQLFEAGSLNQVHVFRDTDFAGPENNN